MNNPKISVIVPVYNVEKYLPKCVESILAQTFTDFELLLVDDGSTDGSGKICDEYAAKDVRVKVFHTENRGVSAARNLGIRGASADWICFVDSDDWVEGDYLETLFIRRPQNNKSLVCQGLYIESEVNPEENTKYSFPENICHFPFDEDWLMRHIFNHYNIYIFAKLFNKKTLIENNVYFCEHLTICEDLIFFHKYLQFAENISLSHSVNYHYIQRGGVVSLSKRRHSSDELLCVVDGLLNLNKLLIERFNISNISNKRKIYNLYGLSQLYAACINANKVNYNKVFNYIRQNAFLFKAYYTPLTIKQRIFKFLFFHIRLSYKSIFFIFNFYKVFFSKIKLLTARH